MVVTRSQANRNSLPEPETMSDSESESSVPDVLSMAQMVAFDEGDLLNRNNNVEHNNIERRFSDMSRQIGEITNIVLSLPERISSNTKEGNCLNTLSFDLISRSDIRRCSNVSAEMCDIILISSFWLSLYLKYYFCSFVAHPFPLSNPILVQPQPNPGKDRGTKPILKWKLPDT